MFRSKFAEDIFVQKYKHENAETWEELASTVVNDVCKNGLTPEEHKQLTQYITELKFIPGGRYLYYAGRKRKFFNNCFSGNTKVLTVQGFKELKDVVNTQVNVISPVDGGYYPAMVYSHGKQKLCNIIFAPVRGKSKIEYKIRATRTHRWPLKGGGETQDLQVGDVVLANRFSHVNSIGFIHGLIFGDGTLEYKTKKTNKYINTIRLCGNKNHLLLPEIVKSLQILEIRHTVSYPKTYGGDPLIRIWYTYSFKELPHFDKNNEAYISSFIYGWLQADGHRGISNSLASINEDAIDWFIEHAPSAGLVISGVKRFQIRDTKFKNNHKIFIQNYACGEDWEGFKVASIEEDVEEEVFCPYEPVHNRIVINHGIDTYNCFLLKALEDSREDWAELSKKSELCLSTGGGIGADYSIYRASGSMLHGTGGIASGPVSKMMMINEIGRQIMQGGSRRSAIYASLDYRHGDIDKFLRAKNWNEIRYNGIDKTLAELKYDNFDIHAPLDITNISVNYLTPWLLNYWKTKDVGEIFKQNVFQALRTGEPGFSFNFFNRENETLRNACTEVTSEDDSDVCNLGSINLGRIDNIHELGDIVNLATKFLLCGTLVAELPYEKVYEIREKNRRLGLGLMGIHEWLIKRGYKYEVCDELRRWLHVYKCVSDATSVHFASKLSISIPVANRAIAPTGTIGILGGTTTGIEPIYAVAYKRRYLKGSKWHYQYVVDSTAQELIDLYGTDPETIDNAIDLSVDYERRIKFQADVQDYVDMGISSTINIPAFGKSWNTEENIGKFANCLASYAHRLRGLTVYPDGSRGGQPLTPVLYSEAMAKVGEVFVESHDSCELTQHGGSCGV